MSRRIFLWVVTCFWLCAGTALYGQSIMEAKEEKQFEAINPPDDSSAVDVREYDAQRVDAYRQDSDFAYAEIRAKDPSLWEKLQAWFWHQVYKLFQNKDAPRIMRNVFYVALGLVIFYILLKLMNIDITTGFYRASDQAQMRSAVLEEDIHAIDFAQAVQDAEHRREYREAVRLNYLWGLKKLTDKHLISWQPDKTNHDYGAEIHVTALRAAFVSVTYFFDNVFYGDFEIRPGEYPAIKARFVEFHRQVDRQAVEKV